MDEAGELVKQGKELLAQVEDPMQKRLWGVLLAMAEQLGRINNRVHTLEQELASVTKGDTQH